MTPMVHPLNLRFETRRGDFRVLAIQFSEPDQGIHAGRAVSFECWNTDGISGLSAWLPRADVERLHAALGEWLKTAPQS